MKHKSNNALLYKKKNTKNSKPTTMKRINLAENGEQIFKNKQKQSTKKHLIKEEIQV